MLQYLEKLQQEDLDELIKKRETQRQLMEDVNKANNVRDILVPTTLRKGIGFLSVMLCDNIHQNKKYRPKKCKPFTRLTHATVILYETLLSSVFIILLHNFRKVCLELLNCSSFV